MSRGLGCWQRKIMDSFREKEIVLLYDLLPEGFTHSQYSALLRAAKVLWEAEFIRYSYGGCQWKVVQEGPPKVFKKIRSHISVEIGMRGIHFPHLPNKYEGRTLKELEAIVGRK